MVHTSEMSALRIWVITFLAFTAVYTGLGGGIFTPTITAMCLELVGTETSVGGYDVSRKLSCGRYITCMMTLSIGLAFGVGYSRGESYGLMARLCLVDVGLIWANSCSLTARTVVSAETERRGATMAMHLMLGYIGGFLGSLHWGQRLILQG